MSAYAPPADPFEPFQHWADARVNATTEPVTRRSIQKYAAIWSAWCTFLAQRRRKWHRADAPLLREFLDAIEHRSHGASDVSDVTLRRYWRLISRVYIHAVSQRWVRSNPAAELTLDVPRTEATPAVVLPPNYLGLLRDRLHGLALDEDLPWQGVRDLAILAVLLDAALTTSELCALRDNQVLAHRPTDSFVLRVDGARPAQRRDILLDPATASFIRRWRAVRRQLHPDPATAPPQLFISRKRPGRLTPKSIFLLLQAQVAQLEAMTGGDRFEHCGANLIRSSVIAMWLRRGDAVSDVIARAGVDTERALYRLAHAVQPRSG